MRKKSSLGKALAKSPLAAQVKQGLRAVKDKDVALIEEGERSKISDSLDLDDATRQLFPNDPRWDYLLSVSTTGKLIGFEPHQARDAEIQVVIDKRRHSLEYLRNQLQPGERVSDWYWVTRGQVGFGSMEKARRRLHQHGITFAGRVLRLSG